MAQPRRDNLALHFQEVLTAIMRLRTNRQSVSDAALFRAERPLTSTGAPPLFLMVPPAATNQIMVQKMFKPF